MLFQLDCWNCGAFDNRNKDTYNYYMGYLGKARGNQTEDQLYRKFPNLVLKGKFREAVQFVCDRQKVGVLKPDELAEDCTGTINENITSVLEVKNPSETIPSCATLEIYEETLTFIPVQNHGGSRRISSKNTFWEFWPRRHGIRSTTGMSSEIWGE